MQAMKFHVALLVAFAFARAVAAPQISSRWGQQSLQSSAVTDASTSHKANAGSPEDAVAKLASQADTLAHQARKLQKKFLHMKGAALAQTDTSLHAHQGSDEHRSIGNGIIMPDLNSLLKSQSLVPEISGLANRHGESLIEQAPVEGSTMTVPYNVTNGWLAQDYFAEQMHMTKEATRLREASDLVTAALAAVR